MTQSLTGNPSLSMRLWEPFKLKLLQKWQRPKVKCSQLALSKQKNEVEIVFLSEILLYYFLQTICIPLF